MARPREFDEAHVLEQALRVFWRAGYEGASIAELSAATGLSRQSLYNAFTDKHGLFEAVLACYVARVTESLAPLERPGAGLAELRRYMAGTLALLAEDGIGACLLVKTAFGPEAAHPEVRRVVEAGAGLVRDRFARVISGAVARGELASTVSPDETAAYLYAVLHGLSALIRTGCAAAYGDEILTRVFDGIAGATPKAAPGAGKRPRAARRKT